MRQSPITTPRRRLASRREDGQALIVVILVIGLLILLTTVLVNQSVESDPIASQAVLTKLAGQAAAAGVADYQNFISQNTANASKYCSKGTFSACNTAQYPGATAASANLDPAFANTLAGSGPTNCNTSSGTWAAATQSASVGSSSLQSQYQYVVDSSALQANSLAGAVKVYVTGRAGTSTDRVCQSVQATIWVQNSQEYQPQSIQINTSATNVNVPTACQTACTVTTATITAAGGSGGNGGTGLGAATPGRGATGQELQTTFQIPVGASLGSYVGQLGTMGGSATTGYGTGGASANPGAGSTSGSGGGGTAVCLFGTTGKSCTTSIPPCTAAYTTLAAIPSTGCVLEIAGGGGGGGEGLIYAGGNGGTGGSATGAFPKTACSASCVTTATAEADADGTAGSGGSEVLGNATGGGGGQWTYSSASPANGSGGTAGSWSGWNCFGFSSNPPSGSTGGAPWPGNGAKGPQFGGNWCYWTAGDGGAGGGGLAGGGSGNAGGNGSGGGGGGGASYFDLAAMYPSTCATSGNCVQIGTAPYGSGFANYVIQNVANSTIPTNATQCLNSGGGTLYTPCSPTFDTYPNWYQPSSSTPTQCTTSGFCNSSGQLFQCNAGGTNTYYTLSPPNAANGQVVLYGGGGGGGYGTSGAGGNGAGALVSFTAQQNTWYAVSVGCGGGGGSNGYLANLYCPYLVTNFYYCGNAGGSNATAANGASVGGYSGTSYGGGGGGATLLCDEGTTTPTTSSGASCTLSTPACASTAPTSACLMGVLAGGGGGGLSGAAGYGGNGGGSSSNTWCTTVGGTAGTYCDGEGAIGRTSGSGTGGDSWFATANGNVNPFSTSVCSWAAAPYPATSAGTSCILKNNFTTSESPCSTLSTAGGSTVGATGVNPVGLVASGGASGAGFGCGGNQGGGTATGYQGNAGDLGCEASQYASCETVANGQTNTYGWLMWSVNTPALESASCNYTPAGDSWPPTLQSPTTVTVPATGNYIVNAIGAQGASGWTTAGTGNIGTAGSGAEVSFIVGLTKGYKLTVVGGCAGFANLGGLGFANGGSSGFQPQGSYGTGGWNPSNDSPILNGVGGGGGGASAICISPSNVASPSCTQTTAAGSGTTYCSSSTPASTCVLAIAGGGGGGGTACSAACSGSSVTVNTDCTVGSGLNGGGGLTGVAASGSTYQSGTVYPGNVPSGSTGSNVTAPVSSNKGYNPGPTTVSQPPTTADAAQGNGGNGGWYAGSGVVAGGTYGGIGAGGGGGGLQGGWADPWYASGASVPTDANPSGGYLTGPGSAASCGGGAGSSWVASFATSLSTGSNNGGPGTVSVLQIPSGSSSVTGVQTVPIFGS